MRNLLFNILTSILFFLIPIFNSHGQVTEINLKNPSFEDSPRRGQQPHSWYDCGAILFPPNTSPDTHPAIVKGVPVFGVTQKALDGNTYLGMVFRENETYESVAQELESELLIGNSYSLTLSLCTSQTYNSSIGNGKNKRNIDFTTPVFLRIWGGIGFCDTRELLAESPIINNTNWEMFSFVLEPKEENLSYLILQVASDEPCNGNLLIDDASIIKLEFSNDKKNQIRGNKDSLKLVAKNQRLAEIEITATGSEIKFNDNKLTFSADRKIRTIANVMKNMTDYKLIIDFNGLRKKKAKFRKEEIEKALLDEGLDWLKFEIRNTEEEDNSVKWLVDDDNMYIGIFKM